MQKQLVPILAAMLLAAAAHGQGTVTFITRTLGTSAQILDWHGVPVGSASADLLVANGQNVLAQLYAAPGVGQPESALLPVGQPVNIRNNANAGYVQESGTAVLGVGGPAIGQVNNVVAVTPIPGGPATVQMRFWLASYGLHYMDDWADSHVMHNAGGASPLLNLATTGGGGVPPTLPVALTGLQGGWVVCLCAPHPTQFEAPRQSAGDINQHGFLFTMTAEEGVKWRVEYSEDLVNWLLLSTNVVTLNSISIVDSGASNSAARFYRARWH